MLNDFQATLYDTFGYLLPGIVFLTALAILFWAIYLPTYSLGYVDLSFQMIAALLLLAYFFGHLNQALGNLLTKVFRSPEEVVLSKGQSGSMPYHLVHGAKTRASALVGIDLSEIKPEWLFRICDEMLVQRGVCTDREIYQYREGFYRGLIVSFFALTVSLIVRTVIPGASLKLAGSVQAMTTPELLFFILLSASGVWLSFRRYRRFSRYRVSHAIIGFLVLPEPERMKDHIEESKNA